MLPNGARINWGAIAMFNIIIGILMILSGLGGSAVLRGTNSSGALALLGFGLVVLGFYQMARHG